jgi:hypothetical protein
MRNIFFSDGAAATVLEHRLKDARKKAVARRMSDPAVG